MQQTIFSEASLLLAITWYPKFAFSLTISYFVEIGISYFPLSRSSFLLALTYSRATKSNAHDFRAFSSPNFNSLGKVGISTNINWNLVNRPSTLAPFSVQTSLSTAHVACLRIFPGILPEMIEGILALENLKGLVLETFGAGNMPEDERLMAVLKKGVDNGIVIVNVTQCRHRI